jgi:hypothetical protein
VLALQDAARCRSLRVAPRADDMRARSRRAAGLSVVQESWEAPSRDVAPAYAAPAASIRRGRIVFSAMKYQWQVWRLNRELDPIDRRYRPAREAEKGTAANTPFWLNEGWQAKNVVMSKIYQLETTSLLRRAAREKVPTPDNDDEEAWIETHGGGHHLSQSAYANLRAAIRKERNEKWDFRLKVLGLLGSTAIGTIGALIGLVTALKK